MSLSTIGFYTSRTSSTIPDCAGIYAWLLPFELGSNLSDTIKKHKKFLSYDTSSRGVYRQERSEVFQWQRFDTYTTASDCFESSDAIERSWSALQSGVDIDRLKSIQQIFALSCIFSKPLYVGLTKNLSARYEQHTSQSHDRNTFFRRFSDFQKEIGSGLKVEDLLFVAIPVRLGGEDCIDDEAIKILEYLLKNVVGPVYGER